MTASARSSRGPRKAIVHIGMPKTGTTSIQAWLYRNREELVRQGILLKRIIPIDARPNAHVELTIGQFDAAGILMPNPRIRRLFGIRSLGDQRKVARQIDTRLQQIINESSAETLFFSVEDIGAHTDTPEKAHALDKWLGHFFDEVRYILYFRRQEDWVVSAYSQMIKTGGTRRLDEYFDQRKLRDYHAVARLWADTVGLDRLDVRLMERDAMINGDLLIDFADALGIDPQGMAGANRTNPALPRAAGEFVRAVNMQLREDGYKDPTRAPIHSRLIKRLLRNYSAGEKYRLSQEQIKEIREINADSNARLRSEFFPARAELFPMRPAPKRVGEIDQAEEIAKIGAAMLCAGQKKIAVPSRRGKRARPLHLRIAGRAKALLFPKRSRAKRQVRN